MTLSATKHAMRADVLARRDAVPSAIRDAFAARLAHSGLDLARTVGRGSRFAGDGPVVSAFLSIRGEPDTVPLLAALAAAGFATALPVTPARGEPLQFRAWCSGDPLVAGRFGTSEPADGAAAAAPDLLFVPLAAFDARGDRLGYGAGYYDGALARLRATKPILAVGVAFAAQAVESVPTGPHDQRLDAVLTERGLITFGSDPCASSSSAT